MAVNGSVSEDGVEEEEVPLEDDIDEAPRRPQNREASPPKGGRRRAPLITIGAAVLAAVAILAVVLSSGGSKTKSKTPSTTVAPPAAGFTAFRDPVAGFTLAYPAAWHVEKSNDSNVPLLLTIGRNPLDTVLVRVIDISAAVDVSNVDNIRAFTNAVISGTNVTVLKQQSLTVNGVPAYYYFYTLPPDPSTGTTLVHSHFFLFPPHKMVSLTFQTVNSDFSGFASMFDQVVSSLRAIPTASTATSTP